MGPIWIHLADSGQQISISYHRQMLSTGRASRLLLESTSGSGWNLLVVQSCETAPGEYLDLMLCGHDIVDWVQVTQHDNKQRPAPNFRSHSIAFCSLRRFVFTKHIGSMRSPPTSRR